MQKRIPAWRRESFAVYLVVVGCLGGVAGDLGLDELLLDLRQTSAGGDELTDDDVLLQAGQRVDLALDSASVRTRVVSWKDAADRKESVARLDLVMPSRTWLA